MENVIETEGYEVIDVDENVSLKDLAVVTGQVGRVAVRKLWKPVALVAVIAVVVAKTKNNNSDTTEEN